jgi:hypothetical protein
MKHKRKWNCAVCGDSVIFDGKEQTLTCKCGTCKATFVNLDEFLPIMGS